MDGHACQPSKGTDLLTMAHVVMGQNPNRLAPSEHQPRNPVASHPSLLPRSTASTAFDLHHGLLEEGAEAICLRQWRPNFGRPLFALSAPQREKTGTKEGKIRRTPTREKPNFGLHLRLRALEKMRTPFPTVKSIPFKSKGTKNKTLKHMEGCLFWR